MKRLVVSMVRRLTAFAWSEEIAVSDGVAKIMELHATEGAMELHLSQHPALAHYVVSCFSSLIGKAPNYAEMIGTMGYGGKEYVLTVKRREGKTPHELKEEAEAKLMLARIRVLAHVEDLRKTASILLAQGNGCFRNTSAEMLLAANELEEALS